MFWLDLAKPSFLRELGAQRSARVLELLSHCAFSDPERPSRFARAEPDDQAQHGTCPATRRHCRQRGFDVNAGSNIRKLVMRARSFLVELKIGEPAELPAGESEGGAEDVPGWVAPFADPAPVPERSGESLLRRIFGRRMVETAELERSDDAPVVRLEQGGEVGRHLQVGGAGRRRLHGLARDRASVVECAGVALAPLRGRLKAWRRGRRGEQHR